MQRSKEFLELGEFLVFRVVVGCKFYYSVFRDLGLVSVKIS